MLFHQFIAFVVVIVVVVYAAGRTDRVDFQLLHAGRHRALGQSSHIFFLSHLIQPFRSAECWRLVVEVVLEVHTEASASKLHSLLSAVVNPPEV